MARADDHRHRSREGRRGHARRDAGGGRSAASGSACGRARDRRAAGRDARAGGQRPGRRGRCPGRVPATQLRARCGGGTGVSGRARRAGGGRRGRRDPGSRTPADRRRGPADAFGRRTQPRGHGGAGGVAAGARRRAQDRDRRRIDPRRQGRCGDACVANATLRCAGVHQQSQSPGVAATDAAVAVAPAPRSACGDQFAIPRRRCSELASWRAPTASWWRRDRSTWSATWSRPSGEAARRRCERPRQSAAAS